MISRTGSPTSKTGRQPIICPNFFPKNCMKIKEIGPRQWRIQDFPEVGRQPSRRGVNIRFCQIFPKTAWNWKNLDPRGGRVFLAPPLIRQWKRRRRTSPTYVDKCAWLVSWFVMRLEYILSKKNTPSSHTKNSWGFSGTTALGPVRVSLWYTEPVPRSSRLSPSSRPSDLCH